VTCGGLSFCQWLKRLVQLFNTPELIHISKFIGESVFSSEWIGPIGSQDLTIQLVTHTLEVDSETWFVVDILYCAKPKTKRPHGSTLPVEHVVYTR
jgi:hypothetical protein